MSIRRPACLLLALSFAALAVLTSCSTTLPKSSAVTTQDRTKNLPLQALIPMPASIRGQAGEFIVSSATPVAISGDDGGAAAYFEDLVARSTGMRLTTSTPVVAGKYAAIWFEISEQAPAGDEAYSIQIVQAGIHVTARKPAGLFYGGITLWQLLTAHGASANASVQLPGMHIEDAPRFAWRGLMLDVARHFRTPDEVKKFIDTMAQHKLNVFHWHLTDDQGWRIQIKKYPKLTEVGGCRIPAGAAGRDDQGKPLPMCGYYTQDEIRDVVAYAAARHVTVVPEIEMPGHAQAAIAAYPQLGSTGKHPRVSPDWGIHTWLYNTDDSTFTFLEDVLTEVLDLFPGQYIHVGGDEAAKDQWQASKKIQQHMKELGIADEAHMQGWFTKRIETWLGAHGRRLIGWDEILEGGLPPQATVMSWRGTAGAIEAAKQGHDVVLAPAPVLYFDNIQSDRHDEPPGRGAVISLKDVYDFEAVPSDLDAEQARHVLGAQGNLWTEHVRTAERAEHAAFPRAAALAEGLWTPREKRDWNSFLARMGPQLARYRALGVNAADSVFAVRIDAVPEGDGASVTLSSQADFGTLRYTTDGSAPGSASPAYSQALHLALPASISARRFDSETPLGAARSATIDRNSLYTRNSDTLEPCAKGLALRLEDDAPRDGNRTVFNTDVFNPCWSWRGNLPQGKVALHARIGQLPFNFQLWRDTKLIVERKASLPGGELQVHAGDCTGALLAKLPLSPAIKHSALTTLDATMTLPPKTENLCFLFASGKHDPMWVIDQVQLLPAP